MTLAVDVKNADPAISVDLDPTQEKWLFHNSWHNSCTTPTIFFKLTIGSVFPYVGPTYPMVDFKKNCWSCARVVWKL